MAVLPKEKDFNPSVGQYPLKHVFYEFHYGHLLDGKN